MASLTKDPNEGLLKALQCPICSNYMVPPISFCENGHNICNACKSKINRCPDCKQPYLRSTNLTLENIARQVEYPCIYQKNGCRESLPVHLILEHHEDCPYGPFDCPVILAGRKRCFWKGPVAELKEHLQAVHKEEVWEGADASGKEQLMVSSTGLHNNVVLVSGEIFYLQFRGQNGNFYGFVKYIGPNRNSGRFRSEISIASKDGMERVTACYRTHGIKEDNEEIIRSGKCLKLHYDVVKNFLDEKYSLKTLIQITKITPE